MTSFETESHKWFVAVHEDGTVSLEQTPSENGFVLGREMNPETANALVRQLATLLQEGIPFEDAVCALQKEATLYEASILTLRMLWRQGTIDWMLLSRCLVECRGNRSPCFNFTRVLTRMVEEIDNTAEVLKMDFHVYPGIKEDLFEIVHSILISPMPSRLEDNQRTRFIPLLRTYAVWKHSQGLIGFPIMPTEKPASPFPTTIASLNINPLEQLIERLALLGA